MNNVQFELYTFFSEMSSIFHDRIFFILCFCPMGILEQKEADRTILIEYNKEREKKFHREKHCML